MAKVRTFGIEENTEIEAEIVSGPSPTGLFIINDGTRKMVRHRDRLAPIDEEAKRLLGR